MKLLKHPWLILRLMLLVAVLAGGAVDAAAQGVPIPYDSVVTAPPAPPIAFSPFDSVRAGEWKFRHALSLDNFLEGQPGYFVGRLGPLGSLATFSRFGMGSGRGRIFLGLVPLNDPQDDVAALEVVPTTAVSGLVLDLERSENIEGTIHVVEPVPSPRKPTTFFELATGDRDLRQRRVRFSTPPRKVGADLAYDDLRNNGYYFDGRGVVLTDRDYGSSTVRAQTLNLRGQLDERQSYALSFRRFESTFQGDLVDSAADIRRDGYVGLLQAQMGGTEVGVYNRGFATSGPDSITENGTLGAAVRAPLAGEALELDVRFDDTLSRQRIGGGFDRRRLQRAGAGINGVMQLRAGASLGYSLSAAHYIRSKTAWGGHVAYHQIVGRHWASLEVRRNFRLPNLGELYKPRHVGVYGATDTRIAGNKYLDPEATMEAEGKLYGRYGWLENEVRGILISARNPVEPTTIFYDSKYFAIPDNGDAQSITVVEDRLRAGGSIVGFRMFGVGGATFAIGDRVGFFQAMPQLGLNASVSVGRELFKGSSAVLVTLEYQHNSKRSSNGFDLDPYNVYNLKVDARLVDAHLYMMWLNLFNEKYATIAPYLMTPQTFLFGIQWTLWE